VNPYHQTGNTSKHYTCSGKPSMPSKSNQIKWKVAIDPRPLKHTAWRGVGYGIGYGGWEKEGTDRGSLHVRIKPSSLYPRACPASSANLSSSTNAQEHNSPHPAFRTGRGNNLCVGSRSVARRDRRRMQWGFGGAMEFVVEGRTGRGGIGEWGKARVQTTCATSTSPYRQLKPNHNHARYTRTKYPPPPPLILLEVQNL